MASSGSLNLPSKKPSHHNPSVHECPCPTVQRLAWDRLRGRPLGSIVGDIRCGASWCTGDCPAHYVLAFQQTTQYGYVYEYCTFVSIGNGLLSVTSCVCTVYVLGNLCDTPEQRQCCRLTPSLLQFERCQTCNKTPEPLHVSYKHSKGKHQLSTYLTSLFLLFVHLLSPVRLCGLAWTRILAGQTSNLTLLPFDIRLGSQVKSLCRLRSLVCYKALRIPPVSLYLIKTQLLA